MSGALHARLHAGAGRAQIAYTAAAWPLDGFAGEHDPLFARVVVLSGDERVALVVVDQTSLAREPLEQARALVADATATPPAAVLVCVSHTFSAPHLASPAPDDPAADRMTGAYDAVMDAVARAAADAMAGLRPASVGAGSGVCSVNVNRDVDTADGWALGRDEAGISDKRVLVIRIDDGDGEPIAILADYAVQPAVMNEASDADGTRRTTSDLAGAAVSHVEAAYGGRAIAQFLLGAAGDQAPALSAVRQIAQRHEPPLTRDAGDAGHVVTELLGERLGVEILRVAESIDAASERPVIAMRAGEIEVDGQEPTPRELFRPRRHHAYIAADRRALPYWLLRVGDIALVGVQPELNASTGMRIVAASPFAWTGVLTMCNGGAKYLPDAGSFARATYAAQSSRFAAGGAEQLEQAIAAGLRSLV